MTAWKLARAAKFDGERGGYLHDHTTHFPAPMRALLGNRQPAPAPAQARLFRRVRGAARHCRSVRRPQHLSGGRPAGTLLDRTSMAVGVEGRVPYLDHRFVEATLAVPPEVRTPGGHVRRACNAAWRHASCPKPWPRRPSRASLRRCRRGLRRGWRPLARRILTRPATLERGWWSKQGIERLLAEPRRHGFRVYTLLMLELAVRIHVEDAARRGAPGDGLEAFADAA